MYNISTALFTPYGYKFESKIESGWNAGTVYERYMDSDDFVWPYKNPWEFGGNGVVDLLPPNGHELRVVNYDGLYWESTGYNGNANTVWLTYGLLYPSNINARWYGTSVRLMS